MAKKDKQTGFLIAVIGLFLVVMLNNGSFDTETTREAKPEFDGAQDFYEIELLDMADRAEVGDLYWMNLKITNPMDKSANMFVQCSILDRSAANMNWLQGLQSITRLSTEDNCVADEPFTQTAYVHLGPMDKTVVSYVVAVPDIADGDSVIWCEAFEECYSDNQDSMQSDYVVYEIDVVPNDNASGNNVASGDGDECVGDDDCASWFWNNQNCVSGYCVDKEDAKAMFEMPKLDDESIKEWMANNKMLLMIIGAIVFFVGIMIVYREPKGPRY